MHGVFYKLTRNVILIQAHALLSKIELPEGVTWETINRLLSNYFIISIVDFVCVFKLKQILYMCITLHVY